MNTSNTGQHPTAYMDSPRRLTWVWIVPVIAVIASVFMIWYTQRDDGILIQVHAKDAYNLKEGDALKFRGAQVGRIETIEVPKNLEDVILHVRLNADATHIAREGSVFWVERPRVSLQQAQGLDTIVGPRYLRVKPGTGDQQTRFETVDIAPVIQVPDHDRLRVILASEDLHSISLKTPVKYRGVQVGMVEDIKLTDDARSVAITIGIDDQYKHLVRANSRFWNESGVGIDVGWSGVNLQTQSLTEIALGGISFATPDTPGANISTGARFYLFRSPEDEWKQWRPGIPISSNLPENIDTLRPRLAPVKLTYTTGTIITSRETREGWAVKANKHWIVPTHLVSIPGNAKNVQLTINTRRVDPNWAVNRGIDFTRIKMPENIDDSEPIEIPAHTAEQFTGNENLLILTHPEHFPHALDFTLTSVVGRYLELAMLDLPESASGAPVIEMNHGTLLGILIKRRDQWTLAPIPDGYLK